MFVSCYCISEILSQMMHMPERRIKDDFDKNCNLVHSGQMRWKVWGLQSLVQTLYMNTDGSIYQIKWILDINKKYV